jgi:hypothetical protein
MLACHGMCKPCSFSLTGPTYITQQPTAFSLQTFQLDEVFYHPELIASLSAYAYARQAEIDGMERQKLLARRATQSSDSAASAETRVSILFLRILAAADYYTLDKSLMEHVPPVLVDIILDPYILNIFPRSLLPTGGYILVVAVASWFLSGYVWQLLLKLVASADEEVERNTKPKAKRS